MPKNNRFAATSCAALFVCLSCLVISGCDRSKMRQLSDADLAAKAAECRAANDPAPVLAQMCKNVERECKRRQQELQLYVC